MADHRFRSWYNTSPSDVQPGDAFIVKLVAVAGHVDDYAVYSGPTDWPDEKVVEHGNKITKSQTGFFNYLMQLRAYRI